MSQAAYKAIIKVSVSSSVVRLTTFANIISGTKKQYQYPIRDYAYLDSTKSVVVNLGSATGRLLTDDEFTVDYFTGVITLKVESSVQSLHVTASVLTATSIIGATQYSLELGGDLIDDTNFSDARTNKGVRTRKYGMLEVSINLTGLYNTNKIFQKKLRERDIVFVEIRPGSGSERIKGWFVVESISNSGDISSIETETISLKSDGIPDPSFSWS